MVAATLFEPHQEFFQAKISEFFTHRQKRQKVAARSVDHIIYRVTFVTSPNEANYEATLRYNVKTKTFDAKTSDISRINRYGDQSACVQDEYPHLRPYCQCNTKEPNIREIEKKQTRG